MLASFLGLGGGLLGRFWRYTLTIILEYEDLSLEHLLFPVTVHYALLEEVRGLLLDFADLFDGCIFCVPGVLQSVQARQDSQPPLESSPATDFTTYLVPFKDISIVQF
jgi:hypothetical protein